VFVAEKRVVVVLIGNVGNQIIGMSTSIKTNTTLPSTGPIDINKTTRPRPQTTTTLLGHTRPRTCFAMDDDYIRKKKKKENFFFDDDLATHKMVCDLVMEEISYDEPQSPRKGSLPGKRANIGRSFAKAHNQIFNDYLAVNPVW